MKMGCLQFDKWFHARQCAMQIYLILCTSIAMGFVSGYWTHQSGLGWLATLLAYIGGGNMGLTLCFAAIFLFDPKE